MAFQQRHAGFGIRHSKRHGFKVPAGSRTEKTPDMSPAPHQRSLRNLYFRKNNPRLGVLGAKRLQQGKFFGQLRRCPPTSKTPSASTTGTIASFPKRSCTYSPANLRNSSILSSFSENPPPLYARHLWSKCLFLWPP